MATTSKPFKPQRRDPCFCNSGKRFKSCCGSLAVPRKPPHGVHVVHDFLDPESCADLTAFAERQQRDWLTVVDVENSTPDKIVRKRDDRRITESVEMGERLDDVKQWLRRAVTDHIQPAYGNTIEWFEKPQLLRYTPGGYYAGHADNAHYDVDQDVWVKTLDREVSVLIYINDEYQGGALNFQKFNYCYRPQAGDLVFFPSDHRYLHEAEKLTSGLRYAIVSWMAESGLERVRSAPPSIAVFMS